VHLPVAAYGALIEFVGFICPLTPLEKSLRRLAGEGGYEGGFVAHYILPVLYPRGLTREVQLALGLIVIVVNVAVYWVVWRRGRRGRETG
jgi:hypothetical protein